MFEALCFFVRVGFRVGQALRLLWPTQRFRGPTAFFSQPGWSQRWPPPWARQQPDGPRASFAQPSASQRFPPPCATHLAVAPSAPLGQFGSAHRMPPRGRAER